MCMNAALEQGESNICTDYNILMKRGLDPGLHRVLEISLVYDKSIAARSHVPMYTTRK